MTRQPSIVGFKTRTADLHLKSPRIFFFSLIFSIISTAILLNIRMNLEKRQDDNSSPPPVVIQITDIPQTRHRIQAPAPPKPYLQGSLPVEVADELIPDEITIEDTNLNIDAVPEAPAVIFAPDSGADDIEDEVFEYYAVEEPPKRINVVSPVYPEMAERAGLKGTVVLKVLVNTSGAVDSVEVVEGPEIFHNASISAARKTKFTPARHNDRPVSCWIIMPFRFVFDNN